MAAMGRDGLADSRSTRAGYMTPQRQVIPGALVLMSR